MKSKNLITAVFFSAGIFLQSCGNEKNNSLKTDNNNFFT